MLSPLTLALVVGALLLDRWLGEPRRWHPLEAFGRLAERTEARFHADSRWRGVWLLAWLVLPWTLAGVAMAALPVGWIAECLILYLAIGWRSLADHGRGIAGALRAQDLPAARAGVAFLVSRDTETLDEEGVAKATLESVLENGNDALFGALFWFLVAGAPGVIAYRLVNTLDAMWGYRTARYQRFGWAAARLDDLLNWVPARLTALAYALAGDTRAAGGCWRRQARHWKSPNAGPVMAAGAGALGLRLGGEAVYHGQREARPELGQGRAPLGGDIDRALALIGRALWVWVGAIAALVVLTGIP
ncbi:adenosylcobinamide-phosphate synthase CbiB [Thioalkalicoccus limnaeus]|uniref:Cobalamin biosynthesis protein CobD n=1 Tax=Thioalkalicoccus limnaeus TaxID=120681 RepID=A0ABV4BC09_9GAMM